MSYQYDVFFSYKRDVESDWWHKTTMEKLRFWLKQELDQLDVPIFFDTEEIRTGLRWRNKICDALVTSRAIVCVWSPLSFRSQWCVSEWQTFAERERNCGRDLIVPASYYDGSNFPPEAQDKQITDLSNYASIAPRFWETEIAVDFDRKCLKRFAGDVASAVRRAPAFDPGFPLVEISKEQLPSFPPIRRIANA